jgi:predicted MFS family arabinose efflux permease
MGLIARFTAVSTCIGFGAGLVIPYLNLYFSDRFGMSKSSIGFIIACGQALTALSIFIGPLVSRRIGPVRAVITFQLLSIPFLLVTGWTANSILAAGAVIIRQALMNCSNPIQDSIMMALVDDDLKSLAVSCGQTVFTLGWALMGPVSTHIVSVYGPYTGYAVVFSCTAVLYLIGSILYGIWFGRHEHRVLSPQDAELSV